MAEHVKLKIAYRKSGDRVFFTVLFRPEPHELLSDRLVCLSAAFSEGVTWHEGLYRLHDFAPFVAEVNGRKNVVDTIPDEGVLI